MRPYALEEGVEEEGSVAATPYADGSEEAEEAYRNMQRQAERGFQEM
jgi:hypothetical protein